MEFFRLKIKFKNWDFGGLVRDEILNKRISK